MKKSQADILKKAEELQLMCELAGEKLILLGSNTSVIELMSYIFELGTKPQKPIVENKGEYIQKTLRRTKAFDVSLLDINKKAESLDIILDIEGEKVLVAGFEKQIDELMAFVNEKEKPSTTSNENRPASSATTGDKGDFIQKEVKISTFHRSRQKDLENKAKDLDLICDFGYDVVLISGSKPAIGEFIVHLHETETDTKKALYPKYWDFHEVNVFSIVDISKKSPEFKEIERLFQESMHGEPVLRLQRIQNKYLMEHYINNVQKRMERPNSVLNRKLLFHGTSQTKPEVIYKSFDVGFDLQYVKDGWYGMGLYFSDTASYSHEEGFIHTTEDSLCQILVVDVFLGKIHHIPGLTNIVKAPEGYDSVQFDNEHVVFNNFHSYPLYLLTYGGNEGY